MGKSSSANFYSIKDPVHGAIRVNEEDKKLFHLFIDHPNFQRLRHIKQLAGGDLIYPGAVHTRFNHSIGASYVAHLVCKEMEIVGYKRNSVLVSALMHDVGHGPMSHMFERIYHEEHIVKHEDWTRKFLEEIWQDQKLEDKLHIEDIKKILKCSKEKVTDKDDIFFQHIISSQLDVDRLDYLLRDSHFCGVPYGHYDLAWLIHCLRKVELTKSAHLGIHHKGVGVVEQYLMARRLMTRNVYLHPKKCSAEFLVEELLKALLTDNHRELLLDASKSGTESLVKFIFKINAYHLTNANSEEKEKFINESYEIYKKLCDYDIYLLISLLKEMDSNLDAVLIAKRIYNRKLHTCYPIKSTKVQEVTEIIDDFLKDKKVREWQLHVHKPDFRTYKNTNDPIYVVDAKEEYDELAVYSMPIYQIENKDEKIAYLFVDKEIFSNTDVELLLAYLDQKQAIVVISRSND